MRTFSIQTLGYALIGGVVNFNLVLLKFKSIGRDFIVTEINCRVLLYPN
jgi:hypothetical protein